MTMSTAGLFNPGKYVITRSLNDNTARLMPFLLRHLKGDWGDLEEEDKKENDLAVREGDLRILSAYDTGFEDVGRIWIITEADRSATTILLPSDY